MRHLSPEQLIDIAEGHAQPAEAAHVASCEACRGEAEALGRVLALTAGDRVPEPSPLFWDHFSERVGVAVREEAERGARKASWVWRWLPVPAVAAVALAAAVVLMPWLAPDVRGPATLSPALSPAETASLQGEDAGAVDDVSWMLMNELSGDLAAEEASAALQASPGTADRALGHLNESERAALLAIIREEMARPSESEGGPSGQ